MISSSITTCRGISIGAEPVNSGNSAMPVIGTCTARM